MLSCCTSITHEARLLTDCYPPSKQLVPPPLRSPTNSTSATSVSVSTHINLDESYKPLSQELSRLTYHASNKPGTLNTLGKELEEKVGKEMGKAKGGNGKSRIYILISLQILRSLILECKRDIPLFSRSALRIMDRSIGLALAGGGGARVGEVDLEMSVRVGACFTAFATYGTAQSLGSEDNLSKSYISILHQFSLLSTHTPSKPTSSLTHEKPHQADNETRNRTRLIGLAALSAAGNSDLLFAGSSDFDLQAEVIIPALMENLRLASVQALKVETTKVRADTEPSPYFSEFAPTPRPAMANRRAPSLRNHVVGEKGPSTGDVVGAALRTLSNLVGQCQANQLSKVLSIALAYMDGGIKGSNSTPTWKDHERCCWFGETITTFSMLQYRFVIPTILIEELSGPCLSTEPTPKALAILAMLTTIFSAQKLSLVGISTTDLLGSLCNVVVRRVQVSPQDSTLPALVNCVASLGCHTYYADQTNDYIEELVTRIGQVQSAGQTYSAVSTLDGSKEKAVRAETVRILVACMTNIMLAEPVKGISSKDDSFQMDANGERIEDDGAARSVGNGAVPRRNPISPTVWQETLPLLCDSSFAVRAEYARSLILYLKQECPAAPTKDEDGEGDVPTIVRGDPLNNDLARFLNALFATLYTLAVSPQLGFAGVAKAKGNAHALDQAKVTSSTAVPALALPIATSEDAEAGDDMPTPLGQGMRQSTNNPPTMGRRSSKLVSLPLSRTQSRMSATVQMDVGPIPEDVAGCFDYLVIQEVLIHVIRKNRPLSILLVTPMLLALDKEIAHMAAQGTAGVQAIRMHACREIIVSSWQAIASGQGPVTSELRNAIDKAHSAVSSPNVICRGPVTLAKPGLFTPDQPMDFVGSARADHANMTSLVSTSAAIRGLASGPELQRGLGLGSDAIAERLSVDWSVEWALKHSVEDFGPAPPSRHPSYTKSAQALMRNSNPSLNSFIQSGGRGIDLADLREALSASRSNSVTGLASLAGSAVSVRSGSGGRRIGNGNGSGDGSGMAKRKLKPEEAREILKDIFSKKRNARKSEAATVVVA